jgi:hypothetical protein
MSAVAAAAADPKPRQLGTVLNLIAGEAILAGQVVGFLASGEDYAVHPHNADGTTVAPVGVALYSQATTGGKVAIASTGSVVRVVGGVQSTAIDAGTQIMGSATTAGMVIAYSDAADAQPFGMMVTGIPSDGTTCATNYGYAYIFGSVLVAKGS